MVVLNVLHIMSVDIKMSLSHNFSGSHAMFNNIVIIKAMLTDFYILIGEYHWPEFYSKIG